MKPTPTRTIGPLHPEDLEPHRFEDLVRQLVYDFRNWRMLEATGRAGSDDGFDARGYEIVGSASSIQPERDEENDVEVAEEAAVDRLWMIQCKREKSIPPAKLKNYLESIPGAEAKQLHGLVFVGACKFSKAAYDVFREWVTRSGLAEGHLWGAAEVEDELFQPKNDHLLFAYFGVSLQTRRRSLKTEVRARLSTKRKCKKHLQQGSILVRDGTDDTYPWPDGKREYRWQVYELSDCLHDGVHVVRHRHFAFLDMATGEWDYAEAMDDGRQPRHNDPWIDETERGTPEARTAARVAWDALPEANKAWLECHLVLPYEHILDIDEGGDEHFDRPHVYTTRWEGPLGPFMDRGLTTLSGIIYESRDGVTPLKAKRIKKFTRLNGYKGFKGWEE